MENQETVPAFEPTPLSDIVGRRETPRASEAPAGQQEPERTRETAPEPGEKPEAKPEQPRDPAGKFAAKPKDEATGSPPEDTPEPEHVPRSALHGERERRQKAERLLAEKEAQLAEMMRRASAPPVPQPQPQAAPQATPEDLNERFWKDPIGYQEERLAQVEQRFMAERFRMSEAFARRTHQDFDQAEAAFKMAVDAQARASGVPVQQTALAVALRNAEDPAEFAYRTGKQAMALARMGADPEAYINAEVERRLAEKLAAAPSQPSTPTSAPLPASLAASRSTGAPPANTWAGPTPLSAIVGPRANRNR